MPMKRLRELNTRECLWLYVLRILSEKPTHAYTIRSEIHDRFGFKPGNVTAYKVLYLLRRDGYVTQKRDGRIRIYTITDKGKSALKEAINFYKFRIKFLSVSRR